MNVTARSSPVSGAHTHIRATVCQTIHEKQVITMIKFTSYKTNYKIGIHL